MSKIKQYIDLMTPMEAYQKGYDKGQEDVCTVSVSDIYEKGYKQGVKEGVEWLYGKCDCPNRSNTTNMSIKSKETRIDCWR